MCFPSKANYISLCAIYHFILEFNSRIVMFGSLCVYLLEDQMRGVTEVQQAPFAPLAGVIDIYYLGF